MSEVCVEMEDRRGKISLWLALAVFILAVILRLTPIGQDRISLARLSRHIRAQGENVAEAFVVIGQVITGEADLSDIAAVIFHGEARQVGGDGP